MHFYLFFLSLWFLYSADIWFHACVQVYTCTLCLVIMVISSQMECFNCKSLYSCFYFNIFFIFSSLYAQPSKFYISVFSCYSLCLLQISIATGEKTPGLMEPLWSSALKGWKLQDVSWLVLREANYSLNSSKHLLHWTDLFYSHVLSHLNCFLGPWHTGSSW